MSRNAFQLIFLILCVSPMEFSFSKQIFQYPHIDIIKDNLITTVEFLTTIRPYRNHKNVTSLNKVSRYIQNKFKEYGLSVTLQEFEVDGKLYNNVIGSFGPHDAERIIVGAHYDVCDEQQGADDNASAVAGLLEIARAIGSKSYPTNNRIDFVAYTLEEPPYFRTKHMGSYVHAKSIHDINAKVKGVIVLEMIGFYSDEENSQQYPLSLMKFLYPSIGNFIAVVGNFGSHNLVKKMKDHMSRSPIGVESLVAPTSLKGVDFSDHHNYWKFNYDAVMITDTAFFRNVHYHQITDTIDTLNFEKMQEVVKGLVWSIINL